MSEKVCVNGRIVDKDDAKLSVLDYGLLYGYGLFETMKAYSGVVFRMEEHIGRLATSAQEIGIELGEIQPTFKESVYKTLKANKRGNAYVRLTVTYGTGKPRINLKEKPKPNYFIITDNLPDCAEYYRKGVKLTVSETFRQSSRSHTPRLKTLNFLDRIIARKEAAEKGFFDALILDEEGFIAEATTSNIFIVEGGRLATPSVDSGILRGITRELIMGLASEEGLEVVEGRVSLNELLESGECFMTNTIAEVMPVVRVGDNVVGDGKPGKTTKRLHEKYKNRIEEYVNSFRHD